jgi:hypothetical protein
LVKVTVVVLLAAFLSFPVAGPERKVEGNVITSERDPTVRIILPTSVQYLGAERWVLYDMADCELHAFVEADPQKWIQRLYWVQFEGYLPTRPELKHTYDSPRHPASLASTSMWTTGYERRTPRRHKGPTSSTS